MYGAFKNQYNVSVSKKGQTLEKHRLSTIKTPSDL